MSATAQIFAYCERGGNPAFWAEPINAFSNLAFLLASLGALLAWYRCTGPAVGRNGQKMWAIPELSLAMLVSIIGIGSFLFHTFATRWAMLADVIPITVFMVAYLGYALRRFAKLPWLWCFILIAAFVATLVASGNVRCGGRSCLNGSVGYLPALAALALVGGWLQWRAHPAAAWLLGSAALFAVSLAFRTADRMYCALTASASGQALGTHFVWHLCNATLLYILCLAAVRHGMVKQFDSHRERPM